MYVLYYNNDTLFEIVNIQPTMYTYNYYVWSCVFYASVTEFNVLVRLSDLTTSAVINRKVPEMVSYEILQHFTHRSTIGVQKLIHPKSLHQAALVSHPDVSTITTRMHFILHAFLVNASYNLDYKIYIYIEIENNLFPLL